MTTIDSLQIEIQSSSTSASKGIDDLAEALGKLKTNGAISTAVKNLNNLKTALQGFTSVTSNHKGISDLAESLGKLQNIGSLNKITNGLKRLPEALNGLNSMDVEGLAPKLQQISSAVAPLSEVKTSGFNSFVNSLKKLKTVTESLDDQTISDFAAKLERLNEAVTPFAEKMATIKSGFSSINSSATSAGAAVSSVSSGVNTATLNFSSFIHVIKSAVQWLQKVSKALSSVVAEATEWDGISTRFMRGFGNQAQETYEWVQKLNKEMGINSQQFMQYASIYSTMLTGFGVSTEDAAEMALGYTELTYDIWAGYNDIYKSYADAADAVKSAIAGEVEPIRKAGFTIVDSQLAVTAANYGVEYSTQSATEAQKSYLRYLTLIDQAYSQNLVGTYAKEMNTAEGQLRTFTQQLKSLAQSFGSLFLPALTKVMPYVQAFVDLLTEAIQKMAALFGIEIQSVEWSSTSSALDSVTDSAEEATGAVNALKNATLGIDELNVLPDQSSGSGGASSSGWDSIDVESLWDDAIFNNIQSQVDAIKEKLAPMFDWIEEHLDGIVDVVAAIGAGFLAWKIAESVTETIAWLKSGVAVTKTVGLALMVSGAVLSYSGGYDLAYDGASVESIVKTAIGAALGIAGSLIVFGTGPAGWIVGISTSLIFTIVGAKTAFKQKAYDELVSDIQNNSIMSLTEAAEIFSEWYDTWAPDNQVIIDLAVVQRSTAEEAEAAYSSLQEVFRLITEDGQIAEDELSELTDAISAYFSAITANADANNDIIHEVLVGALSRASADGVAYYQDLIDAHYRWVAAEQGTLGVLQQQANDAAAAMAVAQVGTAEYEEAVERWTEAQRALSAYTTAESTAKLKLNAESVSELFNSLSSGKIDITATEDAIAALTELGAKLQTTILEIDEAQAAADLAFETEILRAQALGDITAVWDLQKAWKASDEYFASLRAETIEYGNGIGATLAEAIINGTAVAFYDSGGEGPVKDFLQNDATRIVNAWVDGAGNAITNSDELKALPGTFVGALSDGIATVLEGEANDWEREDWISSYTNWLSGSMSNGLKLSAEAFKLQFAKAYDITSLSRSAVQNLVGTFIDELRTSDNPGEEFADLISSGLLDNVDIVYVAGLNTVTALVDGVRVAQAQATPELIENFRILGIDLGDAVADAVRDTVSTTDYTQVFNGIDTAARDAVARAQAIFSGAQLEAVLNIKLGAIYGETTNTATVKVSNATGQITASTYATGGFPDAGSLFVAREAGPEMVGTIGRRTAVANNDQIVEGISEGVYSAVSAALSENSRGSEQQAVNVYLDGKQIMTSVEKSQRERGRNILPGGLI